MALNLRERRLLEAFRACDERGQRMVEDMADQQVEASRAPRPPQRAGHRTTATPATELRQVERLRPKPRPWLLAILEAAEQLPAEGVCRLIGAAGQWLEQYPYSVPPSSVDLAGRPPMIVELAQLMERTSDAGLVKLHHRLTEIAREFPTGPARPARVIQLIPK